MKADLFTIDMGYFHLLKWEGIIFPIPRGKMIDWGGNAMPIRNEGFPPVINKSIKNAWNMKIMEIEKPVGNKSAFHQIKDQQI